MCDFQDRTVIETFYENGIIARQIVIPPCGHAISAWKIVSPDFESWDFCPICGVEIPEKRKYRSHPFRWKDRYQEGISDAC